MILFLFSAEGDFNGKHARYCNRSHKSLEKEFHILKQTLETVSKGILSDFKNVCLAGTRKKFMSSKISSKQSCDPRTILALQRTDILVSVKKT